MSDSEYLLMIGNHLVNAYEWFHSDEVRDLVATTVTIGLAVCTAYVILYTAGVWVRHHEGTKMSRAQRKQRRLAVREYLSDHICRVAEAAVEKKELTREDVQRFYADMRKIGYDVSPDPSFGKPYYHGPRDLPPAHSIKSAIVERLGGSERVKELLKKRREPAKVIQPAPTHVVLQ